MADGRAAWAERAILRPLHRHDKAGSNLLFEQMVMVAQPLEWEG
ncbi:MAG: hypothetical protein M0037_04600 [Betaproteobacteria bacterium]|nr:hypothetical protein [Betaproteobacteria bacterium]